MIGCPKPCRKKRRKHHKASILQKPEDRHRCYLCMKLHGDFDQKYVEAHHVFGGPLRNASEAAGFKAYLCPEHHREGPEAVHRNESISRILKAAAQREYEKTHTREEFVSLIHKNYL